MSSSTTDVVRRATVVDAADLAGIQVRAWWRNYQDFLPPDWLERMTVEAREPQWEEALRGPVETLVLEVAGVVAGYASHGEARDADAAGLGELHALYVDPPAQGAGVGGRLHDAALDALRAAGFAEAVLWCFEANEHARGFYERRGWRIDPAAVPPEEWQVPGVRYRRGLAAPHPAAVPDG